MERVSVHCFASLRDVAGGDRIEVEATGELTVGELKALIEDQHPALGALLGSAAVAVNLRVARTDDTVRPGDEVALLPPVSGG